MGNFQQIISRTPGANSWQNAITNPCAIESEDPFSCQQPVAGTLLAGFRQNPLFFDNIPKGFALSVDEIH
jgi:hypothetical protein